MREQLLNPAGGGADLVTIPEMIAKLATTGGDDGPYPVGRFIRLDDEGDQGVPLAGLLRGALDKLDQAVAVAGALSLVGRSGAVDDAGPEQEKDESQLY